MGDSLHRSISFCPNKWQCSQAKTLQAKGLQFYPDVTLLGSAMDVITRLTEGNQPCNRRILSSSVYPQELCSPLMPEVLLLSWVNQPSQFFSSSYSSSFSSLCLFAHACLLERT